MTNLVANTVLIGLALGLRYPVFILIPAIPIGGILISATTSHVILSMSVFAVLLQLSYLGGALLRKFRTGIADQQARSFPRHNVT